MSSSAEDGLMNLLEAMLALAAREARRPKPPPVKPGGYPEDQFVDLSEEEKEEFSCSICYQILKETMQCVNHHKFCHSCLLVWSTTGQYANRIRCPVCRTHGYYFRNNEVDDRIGVKKVKCHMDSCKWSGQCKYLLSHRHTTYGDAGTNRPGSSASSVASIPRLSQVPPHVPPAVGARFVGTGLTTRDSADSLRGGDSATPRGTLANRGRLLASSSPQSSTSQETVIELPPPSGSGAPRGNNPAPRRVPPVRASSNNRIVFNHSGSHRDGNNNVGGAGSVAVRPSGPPNVSESSESVSSSITGGFTPRPPSAPRTSSNVVNTRRLPRITNPPPPRGLPLRRHQPPEAVSLGASASSSSPQRPSAPAENLGEIRDRLQESRNRLDNLMSSFSGELDRSRQEMADFQQERERQRREQLEEVRELGQRLGQVASELRRLLEHRRHLPVFSDDDDDDDDDEEEEEEE
ncbi:uncharacterized protein LOC101851456 [Aplysia californica]|uniref:Uncharacterized protein LOC101851456 n=1 Tax=Aplysia californica TaxID=6500 RepID=A0ABM0JAN1_APLCA|nr:uncharacterized protein LOC101851456 [Aplysia californica]XP_012935287.1 uncharacterized protein LOC101851456 [Aplysia californica]